MAWLDATPEGSKENRRTLYKGSALAAIEPDSICTWLVYLVIECGLSSTSGMGLTSVPWSEVVAWQKATHNNGLWLASTVKSLSVAYVSELSQAKDVTRGSPMADQVDQKKQRQMVSDQFKKLTGAA